MLYGLKSYRSSATTLNKVQTTQSSKLWCSGVEKYIDRYLVRRMCMAATLRTSNTSDADMFTKYNFIH